MPLPLPLLTFFGAGFDSCVVLPVFPGGLEQQLAVSEHQDVLTVVRPLRNSPSLVAEVGQPSSVETSSYEPISKQPGTIWSTIPLVILLL